MNVEKIDQTSSKELEADYRSIYPKASKFCEELKKQLIELLSLNDIPLAFPIESRVKEWKSLTEKIEVKSIDISSVKDINDLIGLRIILLFRSDLARTFKIIEDKFDIMEKEDTLKRLNENEFGYLSVHYVIELPETWFAIPSFAALHGFKAEIQVRTAAQHIWAAASHKLQYKKEKGVPIPVRRSIHRVSALLELVDLELDRVLEERCNYVQKLSTTTEEEPLNIDSLNHILISILPIQNRDKDFENIAIAELLDYLLFFKIDTPSKLKLLLEKHIEDMLFIDSELVKSKEGPINSYLSKRIAKGVYFTQTGLTYLALNLEFGKKWSEYLDKKSSRK